MNIIQKIIRQLDPRPINYAAERARLMDSLEASGMLVGPDERARCEALLVQLQASGLPRTVQNDEFVTFIVTVNNTRASQL